MPAIHPDTQALLDLIRETARPPFEALSPEEARRAYAASRAALQPAPDAVAVLRDLTAQGPSSDIPLRLYRGAGTSAEARLPCVLYMHGGGWIMGDLDSHDWVCRRLANEARCCIIAVDYRLAPEHRFPAAVEDCAAALAWVVENAEALQIDAAQLALAGDSAGGNLAAVLALMGRDGTVPRSVFQALLYPVTDLAMVAESYERITEGMPVTTASMRYFIDHYAPTVADRTDWRASPLRAPSLAGAPPALVLSCGHDPLCDEARQYAYRLEREGVGVTALHLSDHTHGILTMAKAFGATAGVLAFVAATLRNAWRIAAGGAP
jgi:acetyl esterase